MVRQTFIAKLLSRWYRRTNWARPTDSGLFDHYLPIAGVVERDQSFEEEPYFPSSPSEDDHLRRPYFGVFRATIVIAAVVLMLRLVFLQITQGQENYSLAEGNRLRSVLVPAPRGLLYDRNGVPLVRNIPSFSVLLRANDLPRSKAERQMILGKIAGIVGLDPPALETVVAAGVKETIALVDGINRDQALSWEIKLSGLPGVEVVKAPTRQYLPIAGLGHILGYIGKVTAEDLAKYPNLLPTSSVGRAGLESTYDHYLQGVSGVETLEVDSAGHTIRSIGTQPARVGQSLILSLDSELQKIAGEALRESIEKNHATSGAAVVLDVKTGEVLAMVSAPDFDAAIFTDPLQKEARQALLVDPATPLLNRAIAGQYPSGSTIKPVVAVTALQEKVISPTTKLDTSEGKITVGQSTFSDWKTHGLTEVRQAIAESNNIFFFALGGGYKNITGLGAERLARGIGKFGFGQKTGIDLPGEAAGLIPTPDWKKKAKKESWYIGDTYNVAIGQGDLLVTPLQLTRATAAIANGGTLFEPRLVKSILATNRTVANTGPGQSTGFDAAVLQTVREGMRQTVTSGSARAFASLGVEVAAKTGTAQFSSSKTKTHSWFTAFAPYQNPEIAVAVIVEGGGEGYVVAAPVAKNIIEKKFNLPLTPIVPAPPTETSP